MKNNYTFCLLQYHHSLALGEVLNIGLLLYPSNINELRFIRPDNLNRLKAIYPDFKESSILGYLEYFQNKVAEMNSRPIIFYRYDAGTSLKGIVENELLPSDSSTLQFCGYKKGVFYNDDALLKKLFKIYFYSDSDNVRYQEHFHVTKISKKLDKDEWIKPDFKNKIVKVEKDFIFLPNKNELSF